MKSPQKRDRLSGARQTVSGRAYIEARRYLEQKADEFQLYAKGNTPSLGLLFEKIWKEDILGQYQRQQVKEEKDNSTGDKYSIIFKIVALNIPGVIAEITSIIQETEDKLTIQSLKCKSIKHATEYSNKTTNLSDIEITLLVERDNFEKVTHIMDAITHLSESRLCIHGYTQQDDKDVSIIWDLHVYLNFDIYLEKGFENLVTKITRHSAKREFNILHCEYTKKSHIDILNIGFDVTKSILSLEINIERSGRKIKVNIPPLIDDFFDDCLSLDGVIEIRSSPLR